MKTKCPYTFPHKSRKAMVEYLADHENYGGWNHPYRRWSPLSWNVKIGNVSHDGKRGENTVNPDFDEAWQEYCQHADHLFNDICESMASFYLEGLYTTYPGNDRGAWKFCMAGRSGGHMLLEGWEGMNLLTRFSGEDDWREWLGSISFGTLRTLYRAVRNMDQDISRDNINRNYEFELNFRRSEWEAEHARDIAQQQAVEGFEPCPAI